MALGEKKLAGRRVLIVDDDPDSLDTACFVLEMSGAQVRCVQSVDAGVREVAEFHPDVVVSDLCMPGEDGYSLIRRLRALPEAQGGCTPAVAMTAHSFYEDEGRALKEGFQLFLTKPMDPLRLVDRLRELVPGVPGRP
jgi:CheY-like chemotaxis protein